MALFFQQEALVRPSVDSRAPSLSLAYEVSSYQLSEFLGFPECISYLANVRPEFRSASARNQPDTEMSGTWDPQIH